MTKKGRFITLEGGEASGKTTNLKFISTWLTQKNIPHVITHEPGGTPFAEKIRDLLLHTMSTEKIAEDTELLLMFASRAQHLKTVIMPALQAGQWVVCSRFTDSSYAYQGGGRGVDLRKIAALEQFVHPAFEPDMTLLLDVPLHIAFERSKKRKITDRIEQENHDFFERVRAVFLQRAAEHPQRFHIIDASQPLNTVQGHIIALLMQLQNT
jgi:dTMP kinase